MPSRLLLRSCLVLAACGGLLAQQPDPQPAPAPRAEAKKGDELRRAFVDADGNRRVAIAAAADRVLADGAAGRARLMATLRAVAEVAPKPAAGAGEGKPAEFTDDVKALMNAVVTQDEPQAKAALDKLAADAGHGAAALTQLGERGRSILARCVSMFIRRNVETNAFYAGQYDDLRDFNPETPALLLAWAKEPPKDVPNPAEFRGACVRALRDVLPADQATDAIRQELKAIVAVARKDANENLFLTAVCALHQFGDPAMFDLIKADVEKNAASDKVPQKLGALGTLADLHYQLRKYGDAAGYYQQAIALAEQKGQTITPTMFYNTACVLTLADKKDDAFAMLEKALQASAKGPGQGQGIPKSMIDADHDMNGLRSDERFAKIMQQYFGAGTKGK